ncbi:NAD(P)/FAD-dependent oxidoreductase [Desulfotomaculum copahuensis]|uniref:Pyridine nucleotide-disulfide oxidoreductase n=1 Tax=Desulfotomaculum copahuensis TaxID=1838280 RepID=A0A1B7LAM2_9FIRM|nr:pyridine nucleotide-disulfide oxidoreductase [Desulfotomaculum copahuensis]
MPQNIRFVEIAVAGGGPAGLCAALEAAAAGARVVLIDRNEKPGGQLVKQTHRFFGSRAHHASERGVNIAREIAGAAAAHPNIEVMSAATVFGFYEDGVLGVEQAGRIFYLKPSRVIVATGAAEKSLAFPNNDLPGIYGAGAVQTMVNVYGVLPCRRVLMVGAGNIGVIVSYQLLQAGVAVAAIVEAAPRIGAYWVHAAKVRRAGVPIYTGHTVKRAYGERELAGAIIWQLDENGQPVPGTEKDFAVDTICLSVGLSPLVELLAQAGCRLVYAPQLGGHVPVRNAELETSMPGVYVAGDAAGVEEASAAMVEGALAGLHAARGLGYVQPDFESRRAALQQQLHSLRSGPAGEKIRAGLAQVLAG